MELKTVKKIGLLATGVFLFAQANTKHARASKPIFLTVFNSMRIKNR